MPEMTQCGYCVRDIYKDHEKGKEYFIKDNKPMCMICRATKLSKFGKQIKKLLPKTRKDLRDINEKADRDENARLISLASEPVDTVPKT